MQNIPRKIRWHSGPPSHSYLKNSNFLNGSTEKNTDLQFRYRRRSVLQLDSKQLERQVSYQIPLQPSISEKTPLAIQTYNRTFSPDTILLRKSFNAQEVTSAVVHRILTQRTAIDRNPKRNKPHKRQNHTTCFEAPYSIPERIEHSQKIKSKKLRSRLNIFQSSAHWEWGLFRALCNKKLTITVAALEQFYRQTRLFWPLMARLLCQIVMKSRAEMNKAYQKAVTRKEISRVHNIIGHNHLNR